jgi:hypothetical protein
MPVRFHDLMQAATRLARPFTPSEEVTSGTVAAALLTRSGALRTGVCIDTSCSPGFRAGTLRGGGRARPATVAMGGSSRSPRPARSTEERMVVETPNVRCEP